MRQIKSYSTHWHLIFSIQRKSRQFLNNRLLLSLLLLKSQQLLKTMKLYCVWCVVVLKSQWDTRQERLHFVKLEDIKRALNYCSAKDHLNDWFVKFHRTTAQIQDFLVTQCKHFNMPLKCTLWKCSSTVAWLLCIAEEQQCCQKMSNWQEDLWRWWSQLNNVAEHCGCYLLYKNCIFFIFQLDQIFFPVTAHLVANDFAKSSTILIFILINEYIFNTIIIVSHSVQPNKQHTIQTMNSREACMKQCATAFEASYNCAEMSQKSNLDCWKMCRACSEMCQVCSKLLAMESKFAQDACQLCAKMCQECAQCCSKHQNDHCQRCAQECQRCFECMKK